MSSRELRDSFEHLDERFEEWAEDSPAEIPLDQAIVDGVRISVNFSGSTSPKNVFRFFDNAVLRFWDLELDLVGLRNELSELNTKVESALRQMPAYGTAPYVSATP